MCKYVGLVDTLDKLELHHLDEQVMQHPDCVMLLDDDIDCFMWWLEAYTLWARLTNKQKQKVHDVFDALIPTCLNLAHRKHNDLPLVLVLHDVQKLTDDKLVQVHVLRNLVWATRKTLSGVGSI